MSLRLFRYSKMSAVIATFEIWNGNASDVADDARCSLISIACPGARCIDVLNESVRGALDVDSRFASRCPTVRLRKKSYPKAHFIEYC